MVFSSMLFVLLFFTANIITQALVSDIRKKNIVMLSFSLVFYAWAGLRGLVLMPVLTFICWLSALLISRLPDDRMIRILEMRYLGNLAWEEILNRLDDGASTVYRLHQQALELLSPPEDPPA